MSERILITGGAGFIGSHVADELLAHGYEVRVLDVLAPQVHGSSARDAKGGGGNIQIRRPAYLDPEVELVVGDVCDTMTVRRALQGVDAVFHLAAAVGVGQSMYQFTRYTTTNNLGTAVLLEALIEHPVQRLIVASSMSIYGEGLYRQVDGRLVAGAARSRARLKAGDWELYAADGSPLTPLPTPETQVTAAGLQSVYALSKFDQERLCLLAGRAYGIPTVALRFFNTYGPRQALSNPYTGVLAIFASRILNGKPPLINEDGLQQRDFVHVRDVARACRLALEVEAQRLALEHEPVFNVGSGEPRTILSIAEGLAAVLGRPIAPHVAGTYRVGDIRHCFADIGKACRVLGYKPEIPFEDGVRRLAAWLEQQTVSDDRVSVAQTELVARGLSIPAPSATRSAPVAASAFALQAPAEAVAGPQRSQRPNGEPPVGVQVTR